jgi:hypothetical protein
MPKGIVLHKAELSPGEWEEREGYCVTAPLRTILDTAASPSIWSFLPDAVYDAVQMGLVRSGQLEQAADKLDSERGGKLLRAALAMAEQRGRGQKGDW